MRAGPFDEDALFSGLGESGVRYVLIGRRALVALGIPVLTVDYDIWLHIDDIERLNERLAALELFPTCTPEEARRVGRYVLEGDERVDVLVARQVSTMDGLAVRFDDVWPRRQRVLYTQDVWIDVPTLDDLIATKRWSMRPKDVLDIAELERLKRGERR